MPLPTLNETFETAFLRLALGAFGTRTHQSILHNDTLSEGRFAKREESIIIMEVDADDPSRHQPLCELSKKRAIASIATYSAPVAAHYEPVLHTLCKIGLYTPLPRTSRFVTYRV